MANKKLRNTLIAVGLIAVVGIGGTLAYLSQVTDTKTNTFTMGKGITGETEEPNWKEESGKDYTPGKVIAKDPLIKNTSDTSTDAVYAAATLTYQVKNDAGEWVDTTYDELDKFINIKTIASADPLSYADGFNTADWKLADNNTRAYYTKEKLAAQTATSSIFDIVEIDRLALTPEQVASASDDTKPTAFDTTKYNVADDAGNVITYEYTHYQMKDFQIVITGYMVQGSDEFADCETAMKTAFPDVFK